MAIMILKYGRLRWMSGSNVYTNGWYKTMSSWVIFEKEKSSILILMKVFTIMFHQVFGGPSASLTIGIFFRISCPGVAGSRWWMCARRLNVNDLFLWQRLNARWKSSHTIINPWFDIVLHVSSMMTSSNGNIFRVTGALCGEFTGPGEFPTQKPVTRSFDVFLDLCMNKRLSK